MEKIRLEILGLSSSQTEVGHFALVLGEVNGTRRLPIIIDGWQARAIALEIENIKPTRPMTHDLIVSICKTFEIELMEVLITDLKDGIFFAKLVFEFDGDIFEIDSRTSDAVAIGVRFKVPVYTYENVLAEAGIEVKGEGVEEGDEDFFMQEEEEDEDFDIEEDEGEEEETGELSVNDQIRKLHDQIREAIDQEDYERAARLRDEIARLEDKKN